MKVRNLAFCSVAVIFLLASSGCYTVFQKRTVDGKPPAEITAGSDSECSGALAFYGCTHKRWSHYLLRPWWEESVFRTRLWPERVAADSGEEGEVADEGEGSISDAPSTDIVEPYIPGREFIRGIPSTSAPSKAVDTPDTRHKETEINDTGKKDSGDGATQTEGRDIESKQTIKPARKGGPGGNR